MHVSPIAPSEARFGSRLPACRHGKCTHKDVRLSVILFAGLVGSSGSLLAQTAPPESPPFKPPADIQHPRTPDEPPGAPEKTTGTVQSYEPARSLVLTTADGSKSFDLTHAKLAGDTEIAVGDHLTVIRVVDPRGQVTLTIAREDPPKND
jgi:hypothetical protein